MNWVTEHKNHLNGHTWILRADREITDQEFYNWVIESTKEWIKVRGDK